jgi:hypothetical protein
LRSAIGQEFLVEDVFFDGGGILKSEDDAFSLLARNRLQWSKCAIFVDGLYGSAHGLGLQAVLGAEWLPSIR